jgi:hypothetical protein
MAIYDLWLSRNNGPTISNYVGHAGRLFYDPAEKVLRVSDGSTPGGFPITPTTLVSTTEPTVVATGQMWFNPTTYELWCYNNGEFLPTIDTATANKIGGIKLGPGVTTNGEGQLIINSEGLSFSFGDFYALVDSYTNNADYALLGSINPNEDIVIASNGTGTVNILGEFHVHKLDGDVTTELEIDPVFKVSTDGYITIRTPNVPTGSEGALNIVGSADGTYMPVTGPGGMLHITGNPDTLVRVTIDGFLTAATGPQTALGAAAGYGTIAMRTARGTPASPLPVLADDLIGNYSALGWVASSARYSPGQVAGLQFFAAETFSSSTATGTYAQFRLAPIGSNTGVVAATIRSTGITAATFTGNLTGNVTGNVSGNAGTVTNGVYTTDTGTVTNTMLAGSIANNKLANSSVTVNGTSIALGASGTVTAAAGTLTGTTLNSTVVTSSLTSVGTLGSLNVTGSVQAGNLYGKLYREVRDAGTVADGGTLNIDFTADSIVYCTWGNGMTVTYSNYIAGRVVKVMATKSAGTGTDSLTLGGVTAIQVSTGSTSVSVNAGSTVFMEIISINSTVSGVYIKL